MNASDLVLVFRSLGVEFSGMAGRFEPKTFLLVFVSSPVSLLTRMSRTEHKTFPESILTIAINMTALRISDIGRDSHLEAPAARQCHSRGIQKTFRLLLLHSSTCPLAQT